MKSLIAISLFIGLALAGCGKSEPVPAPAQGAIYTYENFEWKNNEPRKKMIHKDEGFCTIQAFGGGYNGGGEAVRIVLDEKDGYWYLEGNTAAGLTWVRAMAIRIKPIGSSNMVGSTPPNAK